MTGVFVKHDIIRSEISNAEYVVVGFSADLHGRFHFRLRPLENYKKSRKHHNDFSYLALEDVDSCKWSRIGTAKHL